MKDTNSKTNKLNTKYVETFKNHKIKTNTYKKSPNPFQSSTYQTNYQPKELIQRKSLKTETDSNTRRHSSNMQPICSPYASS